MTHYRPRRCLSGLAGKPVPWPRAHLWDSSCRPRGVPGPHGERVGPSGGEKSGSGRPGPGRRAEAGVQNPPRPRSPPHPPRPQVASRACGPELPAASAPGPAPSRRLRKWWKG